MRYDIEIDVDSTKNIHDYDINIFLYFCASHNYHNYQYYFISYIHIFEILDDFRFRSKRVAQVPGRLKTQDLQVLSLSTVLKTIFYKLPRKNCLLAASWYLSVGELVTLKL